MHSKRCRWLHKSGHSHLFVGSNLPSQQKWIAELPNGHECAPAKTCLFSVSEHCQEPDQIGRAIADASLPACRVADRFFSPERRINPR